MMKILKDESVSKNGIRATRDPDSVSRLAGSAHRWDELYASQVQRKSTWRQTNCSDFENNKL
jgi:hypothetical protein